MTVETFFTNFGHLADAPNGVKKLRELILQLAVQGKLVPQDSNDEPASVLLVRIKGEKERLVKEGKIKKQKELPEITDEEEPFVLPIGWEWMRLGEFGETQTGTTPPKKDKENCGNYIPFVGPGDIKNHMIDYSGEGLSEQGLSKGRLIEKNSILMVCIGGSIGKHAINERDISCNQQINTITPNIGVSVKYLFSAMGTGLFQNLVIGEASGSATPIINKRKWSSIPIPLPPESEQKRIVAKVDQLMTLCDELETRQQKQQQVRVRLNNATLDALLTAREPDEFADHWQRISTNFDLLYDHPETIAKLRAAILQLAVQGKLVPQDPNDEPASVLLERNKVEKELLVKRIGARKSKPTSPINESEHPFLLPAGWAWVRLEDFGLFLGGGTPSKQNPAFWSGEIPWVSPKDMKVQYLSDSIDHVTEGAIDNSSAKLIPEGALLMVVRGMILLHSFPVAKTMREVTVNQDMKALICALPDVTEYLLRFLIAGKDRVLEQVERSSHGTCRLESGKLSGFVIALPPKEEQNRIVAKIDQLMTLCDELEVKLNQAQQHSEKLMEATVRQLLVA